MPVAHLQEASTRMNLDDYRMDVQHCFVHKHICSTHINICNMWTSFFTFPAKIFFQPNMRVFVLKWRFVHQVSTCFPMCHIRGVPWLMVVLVQMRKCFNFYSTSSKNWRLDVWLGWARRFFFDSGIIWWEACQIGNIGFWLILVYNMSEW